MPLRPGWERDPLDEMPSAVTDSVRTLLVPAIVDDDSPGCPLLPVSFRLVTSGVRPETQIHTHIGYSGRTEMVDAIDELDADVTAIVATRSIEWVLKALEEDSASGHGLSHGAD